MHFGFPHTLVTDNATTFMSEEFQSWCKEKGITHLTCAPYHPATNGAAERLVQTFKKAWKKSSLPPKKGFTGISDAVQKKPNSSGYSPSKLLNSRQIRLTHFCLLLLKLHKGKKRIWLLNLNKQRPLQRLKNSLMLGTRFTLCILDLVEIVIQYGFLPLSRNAKEQELSMYVFVRVDLLGDVILNNYSRDMSQKKIKNQVKIHSIFLIQEFPAQKTLRRSYTVRSQSRIKSVRMPLKSMTHIAYDALKNF